MDMDWVREGQLAGLGSHSQTEVMGMESEMNIISDIMLGLVNLSDNPILKKESEINTLSSQHFNYSTITVMC